MCKIDMMQTSTLSTPLTMEFIKPNLLFSAISLEFVPTPKLASLKVGSSLVYFSQTRQKTINTCEYILSEFHACLKKTLGTFFCFVRVLGNGGKPLESPKMVHVLGNGGKPF